jgi:hypothetical protein
MAQVFFDSVVKKGEKNGYAWVTLRLKTMNGALPTFLNKTFPQERITAEVIETFENLKKEGKSIFTGSIVMAKSPVAYEITKDGVTRTVQTKTVLLEDGQSLDAVLAHEFSKELAAKNAQIAANAAGAEMEE